MPAWMFVHVDSSYVGSCEISDKIWLFILSIAAAISSRYKYRLYILAILPSGDAWLNIRSVICGGISNADALVDQVRRRSCNVQGSSWTMLSNLPLFFDQALNGCPTKPIGEK